MWKENCIELAKYVTDLSPEERYKMIKQTVEDIQCLLTWRFTIVRTVGAKSPAFNISSKVSHKMIMYWQINVQGNERNRKESLEIECRHSQPHLYLFYIGERHDNK